MSGVLAVLDAEIAKAGRANAHGERYAALRTARATVEAMAEALKALLDRYTTLANSGDAGFWEPEEESVVIDSRAALAHFHGETP